MFSRNAIIEARLPKFKSFMSGPLPSIFQSFSMVRLVRSLKSETGQCATRTSLILLMDGRGEAKNKNKGLKDSTSQGATSELPAPEPSKRTKRRLTLVTVQSVVTSAPDETTPTSTPTPSKKKAKALVQHTSFEINDSLMEKAAKITGQLNRLFPDPPIPLDHASPFQLLTAVVLSAQSTDIKVNEVTPALFALAPDAEAMAKLPASTVEGFIRVLGLAPTKARNLVALSSILVEQHGGQVPDSFEALESLPGVGHKTASVVLSQVFSKLAFPVDTHIHRLAQRWGLTNGKSVEQTEADLKVLIPEQCWRDAHLQMIFFGRQYCPAQRHDPEVCPICCWAAVHPYDKAGNSPARPGKPSLKRRI